jgi:UTP--glucose-1-phosphate uridylyltransferase
MIRKAVIPAAGFGTRFLPATKSQPKEMLPVVDTPTIQYVVQEAVDSGITDILMVIGRGKRAIEEHFDRNLELENGLIEKGKIEELESIRAISSMANIHFIWQQELNGLGDAVLHARHHVGNEPFAVLLGDTILESGSPVTRQLMDVYERYQEPVVALEKVPMDKVSRYGVAKGKSIDGNQYLIEDFVEKPKMEDAPSDLVIAGRYVFTAEIFDYIDKLEPGVNDEIQLTDAMRLMAKSRAMYGLHFAGQRHDIGNRLDFIKTNVILGLERDDIRDELREFIREIGASFEQE